MTIYLPEKALDFREAFDETCDRILNSESDAAFYNLILQLMTSIQDHPLLKGCLARLETDLESRQQDFDRSALEAIEEVWKRLWKLHSYSFKHRKQLVSIKWIITYPKKIISSPLYARILFSLREFSIYSPIFKFLSYAPMLFHAAQSEMDLAIFRVNNLYPLIKRKMPIIADGFDLKIRGMNSPHQWLY